MHNCKMQWVAYVKMKPFVRNQNILNQNYYGRKMNLNLSDNEKLLKKIFCMILENSHYHCINNSRQRVNKKLMR